MVVLTLNLWLYLETQCIHFEKHLHCEQNHKKHVGNFLEVLQPLRLIVVLGGEDAGVEKHQDDDEPEHGLRLDSSPAVATRLPVPSFNLFPPPLAPRVRTIIIQISFPPGTILLFTNCIDFC